MVLPDKNSEGQLITSIADGAFPRINLTSVNFKDISGLENIGKEAFSGNILQDVNLSYCKNLKNIGEAAFFENHITNINLSNLEKLQSIGIASFSGNKITNVDLSNLVSLTEIGQLAFAGNQINNVDFSGCVNLYEIKDGSFRRNQITDLNFTSCETLEKINDTSFAENKLTTVSIPTSVKYISDTTFAANPGNNTNNQVYLYTFNYTNPNNLQDTEYHLINPITGPDDLSFFTFNVTTITGLTEIGKKYFKVNPNIKLPGKNPQGEPITAIADNAFSPEEYDETFPKFKSIDFSNSSSLVTIGKSAFDNHVFDKIDLSPCTNLQEIDNGAFGLPEDTDSSGDKKIEVSFKGLKNLKRIGRGAFAGPDIGDRYRSFDFSGCIGLEVIDDWAFAANSLRNLDLSDCSNLKSIGKFAFSTCGLMSVNLSNCTSLTKIDKLAFSSNGPLQNLDMSNCSSLEIIEESAFDNSALKNLDLSTCTNLKTIGANAFGYSKITEGKIPLSLITLADNAFQGNPGNNDKKQVYLYTPDYTNPNNLKDTNYHLINPITDSDDSTLYTFEGTIITGLSERGQKYFETHHDMKLPAKNLEGEFVTEIGKSAFNGKNLKSVDFSNCLNLVKIGPWAFTNNYITNLDLSPCQNLKIIAEHAFDNSHIDKIDLSNLSKLETIENEAFNNNQSTSLTFKNNTNLKNIGKFAFNQNNLTILDLSGCPNLLNIEEGVFSGGNITSLDLSVVPNISFIGRAAFSDNQITSVNLSGCKNLKSIGEIAFIKNKITDLDLSPCENLEEIGSYSFSENGLNSVNFKGLKNLKTIKYGAFMVNNIKIVDFSDCANLVNLEEAVFYKNKIESLDMSKCISLKNISGWIFGENQLKTAKISSNITSIDESSFANNPGNNAKNQVYLYTPRRNNPMNLKDTDYHLVDPITFTIKKVDAKGNPMEGVEFAFYKVDRPTPPAPPQNETNKTDETELEISSENVPSAVGGPTISMPDIDLELITDGPIPEFFPDPKTIVGVKPIFITATTDKNGTAEVTLPYSPYFLAENKTIPGYSINNTVTPIDATTEGKIITYTDYEVSIEIPETGTLGTLPYILLALILVGGAYVVLRKKKEEARD